MCDCAWGFHRLMAGLVWKEQRSGRIGEDQLGPGNEGLQAILKMDFFLRALGSHRGL